MSITIALKPQVRRASLARLYFLWVYQLGIVLALFLRAAGRSLTTFGLPTRIAVTRKKNLPDLARFALLVERVYYALVMMILPPIVTGSNEHI